MERVETLSYRSQVHFKTKCLEAYAFKMKLLQKFICNFCMAVVVLSFMKLLFIIFFTGLFFTTAYSSPLPADFINKEAKDIDLVLAALFKAKNISIPNKVSDAQLVRRIYLKLAGRTPSYSEITSYLADGSMNKKDVLIDNLSQSTSYDSQMFNWWADLLRLKTRMSGGNQIGAGQLYVHWVKEQIRQNIPFDQMAFNLITAEGYPWENGAVGYYLRDAGMPLDNMSNTTQVFLGTQMVCAQCHNHPFDRWTQMDYYKMASYTYGITSSRGGELQNRIKKNIKEQTKHLTMKQKKELQQSKEAGALKRSITEMLRPLRYGATHSKRKLTLPHDYQYDDAKPKSMVSPSPIFGEAINSSEGGSQIHAYGKWLSSPENPRFTKVIANRIWKKVFGQGLVEPLDDWRDETVALIPELLDHLEDLMIRLDYDLKEFQRVLFRVNTFENSAPSYISNSESVYYFEAPLLQRMSAEQIWDSLVNMSIIEADERKANTQLVEQRLKKFEAYEKAVSSMNGSAFINLARKGAKESKAINDEMEVLQKHLQEAQKADDRELVAQLRKKYFNARNQQRSIFAQLIMGPDFDAPSLYQYNNKLMSKDEKWKKFGSHLYRASELPSPAPPGHFLQEFGQSDREVVDNSNRDASIPQALSFLNGKIYGALFNKHSPLMINLQAAEQPAEKVKCLFLSILNRLPTEKEMEMCLDTLSAKSMEGIPSQTIFPKGISPKQKKSIQKAFGKKKNYAQFEAKKDFFAIAWSLINTRQFSFIQ